MADRKIISISVDPSTYFRLEVLAKRLSTDLYDDVSKSMVVRMAVRKMYEDMRITDYENKSVLNSIYGYHVTDSAKEVDHEKDSM